MEEIAGSDPFPPLRIGLVYNLKKGNKSEADDSEAEYDNIGTVNAIKDALEGGSWQVDTIEATEDMFGKLLSRKPDIVFNIAEGSSGRAREAQVPAILDFLGIPFTGSDATTLAISLDKALTKRLLAQSRVRTPKYRVVSLNQAGFPNRFPFPAIVKPNAEGSSKGITDAAVVGNAGELREVLSRNISLYHEDMLVEQYIDGREFTVGILGNGSETTVFAPMEIVYRNRGNPYNIYSYNVKQNYSEFISYECPAKISDELSKEIVNTARTVYNALGCKDFSRIDFRLSGDGELHFIEINPLPGLAPGYSDYPMLAEFNGMPYKKLVRGILNSALKRYGMLRYIRQE